LITLDNEDSGQKKFSRLQLMAGWSAASRPKLCRDILQANSHGSAMSKPDLVAMPIDEFWMIHKELTKIRSDKTGAQNRELGERLAKTKSGQI
jgi:hypothetical protein